MSNRLFVSGAPHIRSRESTPEIMLDVIIALVPAAVAATYFFGTRALTLMIIGAASAVFFEVLWSLGRKRPLMPKDMSAVVTGLLLSFNLPAGTPFWIPIVGSAFAIIIVKELFGGLGQNFLNPALAARAFLMVSYPAIMLDYTFPATFEGITEATPLALMQQNPEMNVPWSEIVRALMGEIGGVIGETSSVALLFGGIYLLLRRVINWRIPLFYLVTVSLMSFAFDRPGAPLYDLLTGGLILGAFFMATDYATAPVTQIGKVIFGVGCGVLTMLIRNFSGTYPEGVTYAILLMNLCVPLIDRYTRPMALGSKQAKALQKGAGTA